MMNQVKIHLENDTIILHGSPEESVGSVLRGCVIINVKETMKVKAISLNLMGKLKVQWNDKNHQHKKEFTIIENNWQFLPNQKKLHVLTPDTYKYAFEYVLPGNLAETIDANSYGSLSYKLKATVDRPTFSPNLIDRRSFRIIREANTIPEFDMIIPMEISNEWLNKLSYKISIPKRAFCRGEQIPIDISITPKLHAAQLHVRYISCFLKEYTTFILGNSSTHKESKIIRFFRDETFPSNGSHWKKTESISVPYSFESIQCDTRNQFFKVEHKLKFTISFINKSGELSELRASIPVEIMNQKVQNVSPYDAQVNELPTYENAWRTAVYSPLPYLENNRASIYSLPDEDQILTPPYDLTNTENDYFNYQPPSCDQQGLPSYYSIFTPPSYHV